ncbi:hypothetical protein [Sutterella sp.]|uniref:hypothetical protein n=1 Tax=Sutterella sp. TaxID=1981025 RepID=UPI0026DEC580|nr:hypothetical protein [Sutterella sp.]MDO5532596.1 hypothetical protein [Sutterella sp.]
MSAAKEAGARPAVMVRPRKPLSRKKNQKHPGWGGARPGAGRKPEGDKPLDAMLVVRFTKPERDLYKAVGGSAWMRKLVNAILESKPDQESLEILKERPMEHPVVQQFVKDAVERLQAEEE